MELGIFGNHLPTVLPSLMLSCCSWIVISGAGLRYNFTNYSEIKVNPSVQKRKIIFVSKCVGSLLSGTL